MLSSRVFSAFCLGVKLSASGVVVDSVDGLVETCGVSVAGVLGEIISRIFY